MNQERINHQRNLDIRVVVSNPPYSAGQRSANDNAANLSYTTLDRKIADTYAANSKATNKNSIYDSYIRAIKWASQRIGDNGVVAFVTNAGWLDGNAMDGMRKCLTEEYSKMWVFNLRGNARTSGEQRRKEAGNVFESGSRAAITINIFVKNPDCEGRGQIFYHDIGDYLNREEKLARIAELGSLENTQWDRIKPDTYNDWINQRNPKFDSYPAIGQKKKPSGIEVFQLYGGGLKTNRDAWCYNSSKTRLKEHVQRSIDFFNSEVSRFQGSGFDGRVEDFIDLNPTKFSWDEDQRKWVKQGREIEFRNAAVYVSSYRPFYKCHSYFHRDLNNRVYQNPSTFPEHDSKNRLICVNGIGATKQSSFMVDHLPDLEIVSKSQCFPLYRYIKPDEVKDELGLGDANNGMEKVYNISDRSLRYYREIYQNPYIDAEMLFYYVYGILHSPDYCEQFATNLLKQLPRIPAVKNTDDFVQFAEIGRQLGDLHVGYEEVEEYSLETRYSPDLDPNNLSDEHYRVTQMKFDKLPGGDKDKSTIVYNPYITVSGIPHKAYDYVVNGKSAIEWVMDRQNVRTDKASGIVNDANDYALETVGDARYPLRLLQKVTTVSMRTLDLINQLPALEIVD